MPDPPAPRRLARRLALAVGAVALGLALAEAAVRIFLGAELAGVYRPHDVWLYEYVPGVRKVETLRTDRPDVGVAYEIDADGFRGPPLLAPGAAKRVMVYGDSFVASVGTSFEDTFVHRLGERLAAAAKAPVEAIDAGVVGYGPDQVLLRLEADLPRHRPDLVVVCVMPENDYGDLLRNRRFELGAAGELRAIGGPPSDAYRAIFAANQSPFYLRRLHDKAMESLHAPNHGPGGTRPPDMTNDFLAASRGEFAAVMSGATEPMHPFFDHPDADVRLEPASPSARYKRALMARVLGAIAETARRHGTPLVFVVIPAAPDVCTDFDVNMADRARFPAYREDNLTAPVAEAAAATGAPVVDLFEPFRTKGADGFYFRGGNGHWNAAGQAYAAEVTAAALATAGVLK